MLSASNVFWINTFRVFMNKSLLNKAGTLKICALVLRPPPKFGTFGIDLRYFHENWDFSYYLS